MTTKSPSISTSTRRSAKLAGLTLAVAAAIGTLTARAATSPVVTKATGASGTTLDDNQAETGYNLSFFPATKTRIETITYNDGTGESPTFVVYTDTTRTVFPGYSALGWSFRTRTPGDPDPEWGHNKLRTPPGTAAIWGDPSITSNPNLPGTVFIASLQVPTGKLPMSGTIVNSVAGDCSPLGGACIARSTNGGVDFNIVDCFGDVASIPGSSCTGNTAVTLGHFYDGSSMAITQSGSTFSAFAGFIDINLSREAVWTMADVSSNAADPFVIDPTRMGSMGPIGILGGIDTHMRLRADGANLWKLSVDQNSSGNAAVGIPPTFDLKVNLRDRNGAPVVLATDARTNHDVFFSGDRAIRTGPQYAFDIGVNESGQPEMRFVYIAFGAGTTFLQAGFCNLDLTSCSRPFEWRAPAGTTPLQFHPAIKFGHDPETNKDHWKISYHGVVGEQTQVFTADLVRDPTTSSATSLTQSIVTELDTVCPDLRRSGGSKTPGYWGDYDDMAYDACAGSFSRSFSDSSLGCVLQQDFTSRHVHVSSVEVPTEPGLTAKIDGTVFILDQENTPFPNETDTWPFHETCKVDAANPVDSHIHFRRCTGDEVVVIIDVTCTLRPNDSIDLAFDSRLFETTGCGTGEQEDSDFRTVTLLGQGSSMPVNFDLEHGCLNCGDFSEIRLTAVNVQRACLSP